MMAPVSLGLWQLALRRNSMKVRTVFWSIALPVLLAISYRAWDVESHYEQINRRLVAGEACVRKYFADPSSDSKCPEIYPWSPLAGHLVLAKRLGLSFTRY
jgi:hypothetical protein